MLELGLPCYCRGMLAPSSDPYLTWLYTKELPLSAADRVGILWGYRSVLSFGSQKGISNVQLRQRVNLYSSQSSVGLFSFPLLVCLFVLPEMDPRPLT